MITSITVQVELMMYGFVAFDIGATKNGVKASWIAVADGGNILDNDSMEYGRKGI